jgi:hypothetical protein
MKTDYTDKSRKFRSGENIGCAFDDDDRKAQEEAK